MYSDWSNVWTGPVTGTGPGHLTGPCPDIAAVRGKLSFTGVVSVTLNFHPQGRNVNDVTNEEKS